MIVMEARNVLQGLQTPCHSHPARAKLSQCLLAARAMGRGTEDPVMAIYLLKNDGTGLVIVAADSDNGRILAGICDCVLPFQK